MYLNTITRRVKMQRYLLMLRFIDGSDGRMGKEFLSVVNEEWRISHDCDPSEGANDERGSGWIWDIITYHYVPIDESGRIDIADIKKLVSLSGCSILEKELSINYDEY